MARSSIKEPPVLISEDMYEEWKKDLSLWQLVTPLAAKQQGPAVYLSLQGRARDCVRGLQTEDIGKDSGVKMITDQLDLAFLGDINSRTFSAFKKFHEYKRI